MSALSGSENRRRPVLAPPDDFRRDSDLFGHGAAEPAAQPLIATAVRRFPLTRAAEIDLGQQTLVSDPGPGRRPGNDRSAMSGDWSPSIAQASGLLGQTVLIIGTCTGAGLATARRAKGEGAQLILTDRCAGPLEDLADEIGVEATAAFDESDVAQLETFLGRLPGSVDHVMLSGGEPYTARLSEIDLARARGALDQLLVPICIGRYAAQQMRDGGSLVFVTGARGGGRVTVRRWPQWPCRY